MTERSADASKRRSHHHRQKEDNWRRIFCHFFQSISLSNTAPCSEHLLNILKASFDVAELGNNELREGLRLKCPFFGEEKKRRSRDASILFTNNSRVVEPRRSHRSQRLRPSSFLADVHTKISN